MSRINSNTWDKYSKYNNNRRARPIAAASSAPTAPIIPKFSLLDENFPDIAGKNDDDHSQTNDNNGTVAQSTFNYMDAIQTENVADTGPMDDDSMPGWVQMKMINGEVLYLDNSSYVEEVFNPCFDALIQKWDDYAYMYDETYGEGEYDKMYSFPQSHDECEYDDDSSSEGEWGE